MTFLGGNALIFATCLMVCLMGPALHAQSNFERDEISPQSNILYGDQDSASLTNAITLHWTAPGDDGNTGRATRYDLRARPASYGPIDTQQEWNQAYQISNEPAPSIVGRTDSLTISGLAPGSQYYFCIRTYDEANNLSAFSNSPLLGAQIPDPYIAGDANNSGAVNGLDIVFLVAFLKNFCEIPEPQGRADVNRLPGINGLDVAYLRAYMTGGPPPQYPEGTPKRPGTLLLQADVGNGNRQN
jgi:hypothetical protein